MAKLAPTRLAGTIVATALCAVLASKAAAQDATTVLNEQLQLGDVFSHQSLNVVDAGQQVGVSSTALGNQINGGTEGQSLRFVNQQTGFAAAVAQTRLNMQGQTRGRVTVVNQARVNEASVAANDAPIELDSRQYAYGPAVSTVTQENTEARLIGGASITSAAYSNSLHAGGNNTFASGTIHQESTEHTLAQTNAPALYVPGQSSFHSDAASNSVQVVTTGTSGQDLGVSQDNVGWTGAESISVANNAWDTATTSSAAANRALLYNAGGSQLTMTNQSNSGDVYSHASAYAYEFGQVRVIADGVGNQTVSGNNDIWIEVDNNQINTGGVAVSAYASGHTGYDAYVGANATGNSVTGYACSDCGGVLTANNVQNNSGPVSATANTSLSGPSRAVITGTTATGNSANFHVTRPAG